MKQITHSEFLDGLGWLWFYLGLLTLIPCIPMLAVSYVDHQESSFTGQPGPLFWLTWMVLLFIVSFSGYKFVQRKQWSWYVLFGVFVLVDVLFLYMIFDSLNYGVDLDVKQDDDFYSHALVLKYSIAMAYCLCVLGVSSAIAFLFKKQCREAFHFGKA